MSDFSEDAPLTAEVISIGDEMTSGARIDTNSAWLSQRLAELGIRTLFHSTVADDLAAGIEVFRIAAGRADVIIATGGLGPTADDLTREVLSLLVEQPLEFRPAVMEQIAALFAGRGRTMPERNRVQAMFPIGSRVIPNPQGTAPGLDLAIERAGRPAARVFALPGVPAEMHQMFQATVQPRLIDELGAGQRIIRQHVVKCFGVGESEMESRLGEMIARKRVPTVGITVSRATIALRITAEASSEAEVERQIQDTRSEIFRLVPEFIFGEGERYELQHAVTDQLVAGRQTLATIELGAACPLMPWLVAADHQNLYRGGMYGHDLAFLTPTSPQTQSLGDSLRAFADRTAVDWVLLVDRYPHIPAGDQPLPAFPVTFTLWQRAGGKLLESSVELGGHPDIIHSRIAKAALQFLHGQLGK